MELFAIHQYMNQHDNQFLLVCRENGDSTSMKLFETITDEEQIHFNYFDNVSDHIKKLGAAYRAQIAGTPADTVAPSKRFVTGPGRAAA